MSLRLPTLVLALALLGGCSFSGALSFGSAASGLKIGLHQSVGHTFIGRGSHVHLKIR